MELFNNFKLSLHKFTFSYIFLTFVSLGIYGLLSLLLAPSYDTVSSYLGYQQLLITFFTSLLIPSIILTFFSISLHLALQFKVISMQSFWKILFVVTLLVFLICSSLFFFNLWPLYLTNVVQFLILVSFCSIFALPLFFKPGDSNFIAYFTNIFLSVLESLLVFVVFCFCFLFLLFFGSLVFRIDLLAYSYFYLAILAFVAGSIVFINLPSIQNLYALPKGEILNYKMFKNIASILILSLSVYGALLVWYFISGLLKWHSFDYGLVVPVLFYVVPVFITSFFAFTYIKGLSFGFLLKYYWGIGLVVLLGYFYGLVTSIYYYGFTFNRYALLLFGFYLCFVFIYWLLQKTNFYKNSFIYVVFLLSIFYVLPYINHISLVTSSQTAKFNSALQQAQNELLEENVCSLESQEKLYYFALLFDQYNIDGFQNPCVESLE